MTLVIQIWLPDTPKVRAAVKTEQFGNFVQDLIEPSLEGYLFSATLQPVQVSSSRPTEVQ